MQRQRQPCAERAPFRSEERQLRQQFAGVRRGAAVPDVDVDVDVDVAVAVAVAVAVVV